MDIKQYRKLTNHLFTAIRNVETCASERERMYTMSLVFDYTEKASVAYCNEAESNDLESMDLALRSVFDLIETHHFTRESSDNLRTALH
mgnify:CR=1 FL=1